MNRLFELWMDRHRGKNSICGRFVMWMDVRWLRRMHRVAKKYRDEQMVPWRRVGDGFVQSLEKDK